MNVCQQKQTDLLSFTSKLTDKNTTLQSDNSALEERLNLTLKQLENVTGQLNQSSESIDVELKRLNARLDEEIRKSSKLLEQLEEKTKQTQELSVRLADEQNENATLKKKHAANTKDLTRQLQALEKKSSSHNAAPLVGLSSSSANSTASFYRLPSNSEYSISAGADAAAKARSGSRTNSISSLNDRDDVSMNSDHSVTRQQNLSINSDLLTNENVTLHSQTSISTRQSSFNHHTLNSNEVICGNDEVYVVDIEKQKIIEKIVKLQKTLAKRNEKIDFLQDHVNQLTADLKRKTK
jgi:hypothetical protein